MDVSGMSTGELRWLEADEALWRKATEIAEGRPGCEASGVYHVLKNLQRPVEERLRRGLAFGRLRRR